MVPQFLHTLENFVAALGWTFKLVCAIAFNMFQKLAVGHDLRSLRLLLLLGLVCLPVVVADTLMILKNLWLVLMYLLMILHDLRMAALLKFFVEFGVSFV